MKINCYTFSFYISFRILKFEMILFLRKFVLALTKISVNKLIIEFALENPKTMNF